MGKFLAYTSEEGSRQLIWAATGGNDREKELQGAFITRSDITEPSDYILGEEGMRVQKQLWVRVICSVSSFPDPMTDPLRFQTETIDVLNGISPKVSSVMKALKRI